MLKQTKQLIKNTPIFLFLKELREKEKLENWEKSSMPRKGPLPHILKQFTVKDYANKYGCAVLVETGTFEGDMVRACINAFNMIYSIELNSFLYKAAVEKFKKNSNVKIIQGDSGVILGEILAKINIPCVFWLDGHYSAGGTARGELDTPITKEIEFIFAHPIKNHVILIDDARCFDGTNDYPRLDLFVKQLHKLRPDIKVEVYNDVIRITSSNLPDN